LLRTAKFRSEPATLKQKQFLKNWWTRSIVGIDEKERAALLENITKGEAANIITRLKHGAQVRMIRGRKCSD
jgi:ATP-dependent helicase IRC3